MEASETTAREQIAQSLKTLSGQPKDTHTYYDALDKILIHLVPPPNRIRRN